MALTSGEYSGLVGPGNYADIMTQERINERFNRLAGRQDENLNFEQGAIDDWRNRFRDDYLEQMRGGGRQAAGNIQADAGARGFSSAMSQGAQQAGGNVMANTNMQAEGMKRQMTLADAMAQYAQSQRASQLELARQDMLNQINAAGQMRDQQETEAWNERLRAIGVQGKVF